MESSGMDQVDKDGEKVASLAETMARLSRATDYNGKDRETLAKLANSVAALTQTSRSEPEPLARFKFLKTLVETMLPSVIMFALGYIFIQGVELDLKREQFTASSADKVKLYVETLTVWDTDKKTKQELDATALALGGFGGVAAYPLVAIIEAGGTERLVAAKTGLEQAGRVAPETTCGFMASVIDDRTGAYVWRTRKAVAEVAGRVGCAEAKRPLERFKRAIVGIEELDPEQLEKLRENAIDDIEGLTPKQLANLRAMVNDDIKTLEALQLANLKTVLETALNRIATSSSRRTEWQ